MYFKTCLTGNFTYANRHRTQIKYIVYHFTSNDGDTARNNVDYFARKLVKTSAHYFVDDIEVCASVPWYHVAWHCGGKKYPNKFPKFYGKCNNANSIGVEMCSRVDNSGGFYITEATQRNAAKHIALLMHTYDIPIERVCRHYDVVGKHCPAPMVDEAANNAFRELILFYYNGGEDVVYYEKLEDIPAGVLRDTIKNLIDDGIIKGDSNGLHLSYDMVRMLVFMERRFTEVK